MGNGRELARQVAASLASANASSFEAELASSVSDPAAYEASVRGGPGALPRAGRMMIERASPRVLHAIGRALDVPVPAAAALWTDLAAREGVPIIAGWDVRGGGGDRCLKLYVNASDASSATRERVRAALLPGVDVPEGPPALVGINARADGGAELKAYVQSADARALAERAGSRAASLAHALHEEGADAGGVLSFDVAADVADPRAFFVALREPNDDRGYRAIQSLSGYDPMAIEELLPFAPAPPRSVGVSLTGSAWTLYMKPRDSSRAPVSLEPAAIFRSASAEVGVFVEPTAHAPRAFRRTARHAVSVRIRDGSPSPEALEALVDWVTARLRAHEEEGGALTTVEWLHDPPAPWHPVPPSGARA